MPLPPLLLPLLRLVLSRWQGLEQHHLQRRSPRLQGAKRARPTAPRCTVTSVLRSPPRRGRRAEQHRPKRRRQPVLRRRQVRLDGGGAAGHGPRVPHTHLQHLNRTTCAAQIRNAFAAAIRQHGRSRTACPAPPAPGAHDRHSENFGMRFCGLGSGGAAAMRRMSRMHNSTTWGAVKSTNERYNYFQL